jgi:DNA mismatch repair protein MutS
MSVQERGGEIQFLHSLQKGPANRSYGIHVAKLAGIPAGITSRAQKLLDGFEGQGGKQLSLTETVQEPVAPPWLEEFKNANLSHMTPLEALNKLCQWQREVSS